MGQATTPFKPIALVVEDDVLQREIVVMLLEESEMGVIQCDNGEDALEVIEKLGPSLSLLYTDVNLAGRIDGVELAHFANENYPNIHVLVASGFGLKKALPENALFMPKPWQALDLLREAERAQH
ncbi:MAG TPA: response regulator [Pseudolabrys sp.]|nr:response regulator [Pseudolabrys sp.]